MVALIATALSHTGLVRRNNQDSAYAGSYLFAVADGMGGHAGGDIASAMTIQRIVELDHVFESEQEAGEALRTSLLRANQELSNTVVDYPELTGMGTTFSGLLLVGDTAVVAHIGDSRIYLFRDGELRQITKDHTFVQRLVDAGRITPEEALVHPRRSVIMRVLGDIDANPDIDVFSLPLLPGDRLLICSDGVAGPVGDARIAELLHNDEPGDRTAARLLQATLDAGAPDNATVVLAEVADQPVDEANDPRLVVGAAAEPVHLEQHVRLAKGRRAAPAHNLNLREVASHLKSRKLEPTQFESQADEYLAELIDEGHRRTVRRRLLAAVLTVVIVGGIVVGCVFGYRWTQSQYYLGVHDGYVVIYQGISQDLGPVSLSHIVEDARLPQVPVSDLSTSTRDAVQQTISYSSFDKAADALTQLKIEAGE